MQDKWKVKANEDLRKTYLEMKKRKEKLVETIDLLNKEKGVGSPYKDQPKGNDGE